MTLVELAEDIRDYLNTLVPTLTSSSDLVQDKVFQAECALDPSKAFENSTHSLYVVPVVVEYNREASGSRERIKMLSSSPVISVVLSLPFQSFVASDVASWEEVSQVLNLREVIDKAIATHDWGIPIDTIRAEPAQEVTLNQKWFLSITEFVFKGVSC
jgi:hypothetical protein